MLNICLILVLILSSIVICGAFLQKDMFTKLLFINTGTSIAALFICFLGSFKVNSSYIDIALIYFLLSVVATSAYLKYFMQKHKKEKSDAA
jgi:multisubunit Na+/H+ antiporter MnhF subunit